MKKARPYSRAALAAGKKIVDAIDEAKRLPKFSRRSLVRALVDTVSWTVDTDSPEPPLGYMDLDQASVVAAIAVDVARDVGPESFADEVWKSLSAAGMVA